VGYLLDDINTLVWQKNKPILFLFVVFLIIGMLGSKFIASHLKKELHDMEPKEIAALLLQKDAILQSVKEGIIVVDNNNKITLINQSAKIYCTLPPILLMILLKKLSEFHYWNMRMPGT